MSGITTLNTTAFTENVTSTFAVTLNSLGTEQISGTTTSTISSFGQKLFKLTILSSSNSYPISPSNYIGIYGLAATPSGYMLYVGNNSVIYGSNTSSCSNILSQRSYITNGISLNVGQYLYDVNFTPINGGNNWVSLWLRLFDYQSPSLKSSIQVSPTGEILDVVPC